MIDRILDEFLEPGPDEPVVHDVSAHLATGLHDRIIQDRGICGGHPIIKGTRIPVRTIIASLAEGDRPEDIICDFPTLTTEDIRAAVAFARATATTAPSVFARARAS